MGAKRQVLKYPSTLYYLWYNRGDILHPTQGLDVKYSLFFFVPSKKEVGQVGNKSVMLMCHRDTVPRKAER